MEIGCMIAPKASSLILRAQSGHFARVYEILRGMCLLAGAFGPDSPYISGNPQYMFGAQAISHTIYYCHATT
jgi:hypothetical protein